MTEPMTDERCYTCGNESWCPTCGACMSNGNAEFIAHARTLVPALVAEVEKLRDAYEYTAHENGNLIKQGMRARELLEKVLDAFKETKPVPLSKIRAFLDREENGEPGENMQEMREMRAEIRQLREDNERLKKWTKFAPSLTEKRNE